MPFRFRSGSVVERRGTPADLLVVGLGNPGAEYQGTRHNVGSDTVALLAQRHGQTLRKTKERAVTAEIRVGPARLALAFPLTFMNLSGESVRLLVRRYGIEDPARLLVVHDELDLEVGRLKLKSGGGLAGHNGLRSISQHLGTNDFARLRIGIGKPPGSQAGRDFVLRRPGKAEEAALAQALEAAADAVEQVAVEGIDAAMNAVNRRAEPTGH